MTRFIRARWPHLPFLADGGVPPSPLAFCRGQPCIAHTLVCPFPVRSSCHPPSCQLPASCREPSGQAQGAGTAGQVPHLAYRCLLHGCMATNAIRLAGPSPGAVPVCRLFFLSVASALATFIRSWLFLFGLLWFPFPCFFSQKPTHAQLRVQLRPATAIVVTTTTANASAHALGKEKDEGEDEVVDLDGDLRKTRRLDDTISTAHERVGLQISPTTRIPLLTCTRGLQVAETCPPLTHLTTPPLAADHCNANVAAPLQ